MNIEKVLIAVGCKQEEAKAAVKYHEYDERFRKALSKAGANLVMMADMHNDLELPKGYIKYEHEIEDMYHIANLLNIISLWYSEEGVTTEQQVRLDMAMHFMRVPDSHLRD